MVSGQFFPAIEPYLTGSLQVSALHQIYWEECGNPNGLPVVFLHGGPGAGASQTSRRMFDPAVWRIVLFDQRGCGRSTPLDETRENTTAHLVADIESLRQHRGIDRWHVFGGSWGSTLALAYAQTHPERCLGLMLRGIFLMTPKEIDWFFYGMRSVFPEQWEAFAGFLPPSQRADILNAYSQIFEGKNAALKREAKETWLRYETSCASLLQPENDFCAEASLLSALPTLEAHYMKNNIFQPEDALLQNIGRIRSIPGIIVHGRYDMICPCATAYDLHRAWPESTLRIVPASGHSLYEPAIREALIEATESFKTIRG